MNKILKRFFSNITVKGELVPPKNKISRWEVVDAKLREPYDGFLKNNDFGHGRGDRT